MTGHAQGSLLSMEGSCKLVVFNAIQKRYNVLTVIEKTNLIIRFQRMRALERIDADLVGCNHGGPVLNLFSGKGRHFSQFFIFHFRQSVGNSLQHLIFGHGRSNGVTDSAPGILLAGICRDKSCVTACAFAIFNLACMTTYTA